MSESDASPSPSSSGPAQAEQPSQITTATVAQAPAAPTVEDRSELLQRAKAFLTSPQVLQEDITAKRRFLTEKGLSDVEVEALLRETARVSCTMLSFRVLTANAAASGTCDSTAHVPPTSLVKPAQPARRHI